MTNTCLQCGAKILGRSDKKFCNTECRNTHNNQLRSEAEKFIIDTNRIL
jgi:predicted nucleic acid-binding Zn ribbon protein